MSEVRQEGDSKFLYKLKVDSATLRKRNINARPTDYVRRIITAEKLLSANNVQVQEDQQPENNNQFQNEFDEDKKDSSAVNDTAQANVNAEPASPPHPDYISKSKLYDYKLKFEADYVLTGVTNNILINRYQPFGGYMQEGPIRLNTQML